MRSIKLLNTLKRFHSNSIIPAGTNHLASANNTNKLLKPQLKHLDPFASHSQSTKSNSTKLSITHNVLKIDPTTYVFNVALNASVENVKPALFVACLDVSGSMNDSLNDANDSECSKFSRWDLVKHSMNTIIHCLRPIDKLAICVFSDNSNVILKPTKMDENGKRTAIKSLNDIGPDGYTNLWSGLDSSLGLTDSIEIDGDHNIFTLVLTDGEPNINPPRGIIEELLQRNSINPLKSTVHTFGYGYGLDSSLLRNMAVKCGGLFAYIPDHTMCNSVFINFLSNCLATSVNMVDVILPKDVAYLSQSHLDSFNTNNKIKLGSVQSCQAKNVILACRISDPHNFERTIKFKMNDTLIEHKLNNITRVNTTENHLSTYIFDKTNNRNVRINMDQIKNMFECGDTAYQMLKYYMIKIINDGIAKNNLKRTTDELDNLYEVIEISAAAVSNNDVKEKLEALLKNIRSGEDNFGQIHKAFSRKDWHERWGRHYLKSIVRAHELQMCSNFKDPSLQHYGGQLFRDLKSEIESIFSTIPTPQPSLSSTPYNGNYQQSFYKPSGPCVGGYGKVRMATGFTKYVKDLVKGDLVVSNNNVEAYIIFLRSIINLYIEERAFLW